MPPEKKWWIVLADFGISKRANESNGPTTAIKGTDGFMAPELLGYLDDAKPKSIADFKAADMWAFGEILFQMLTGEATFQNPVEMMRYCLGQREFPSNRLPTAIADDGYEFIGSLMMALPRDRRTTTQCIQHRWIESLVEDEFDTLKLEHKDLPMPENSRNEPPLASAQGSSLPSLEHRPTQTTAQWKPETLLHSSYFSARHDPLQSTFSGQSNQQHLDANQGTLNLVEIALEQAPRDECMVFARGVSSLAFSPNGKWLVSKSSGYDLLQLWDVSSGGLVEDLETFSKRGSLGFTSNVGFSPDGQWLAFANTRPTCVQLWDAESKRPVWTLEGHWNTNGCIYYVVFSPDSKHLASAHTCGTVHLFDVRSGTLVHLFDVMPGMPRVFNSGLYSSRRSHLAFSPDGGRLAFVFPDGTVWFWEVGSAKVVRQFEVCLDGDSINNTAFSPDCKRLASISSDGTVRLWDAGSGKLMEVLESGKSVDVCLSWSEKYGSTVSGVGFSPDSKRVTSTSNRSTVQLWDAGSGELVQSLETFSEGAINVTFSPDGKRLASTSTDQMVRLWDAVSGELVHTLKGHQGIANGMAFSPDGERLSSMSKSGEMLLWDVKYGELVQTLEGDSGWSHYVIFSPDGKQLAAASDDGKARLWGPG